MADTEDLKSAVQSYRQYYATTWSGALTLDDPQ